MQAGDFTVDSTTQELPSSVDGNLIFNVGAIERASVRAVFVRVVIVGVMLKLPR